MLKNKWFIAAVAVLLTTAVVYDVWYFFLREEEPAGQVAGSAAGAGAGEGGGPAADAGRPAGGSAGADADSAAPPVSPLVEAAAEGRPTLRDPGVLERVRGGPDGSGWGREPLARTGILAGDPDPEPDPPAPEVQPPDWELSAVMVGRDRRAAVVDGRVVRVGDTVRGGGEVVEIRRGEVVVRWRGRRLVVQLPMPN